MLGGKARRLLWPWLSMLLAVTESAARSSLTDSTDVMIPTQEREVENSIAVSPLNPRVLLVSNIKMDGYSSGGVTTWISTDAGKTWGSFSVLAPSKADPVTAIGRWNGGPDGRYFVNHIHFGLGTDYDVGAHYSNDGSSWTYSAVQAGLDVGWDKNYLCVDNGISSARAGRVYCGFSTMIGEFRIYLKYSTNHGNTWAPSLPITIDEGVRSGYDQRGVNIQTAPSGRVYATWGLRGLIPLAITTVGIHFRYSTSDQGGTMWNSPTYGQQIKRLKGFERYSLLGKLMRVRVSPSMAVDRDSGRIYIVYADREDQRDDTDIYVICSADSGLTWDALGGTEHEPTNPAYKRVNTETPAPNKDQWFPWIAWDDCTGALVVVFYDSRDITDKANTYMAVSYDGGETWQDFKVSDTHWEGEGEPNPWGDPWAGDYIGVAAKDGMAFPLWSDDRFVQYQFKPYVSPIYLWSIQQSTVSSSYIAGPGLELTVTGNWNTDAAVTATDSMFLTSPTNLKYTGAKTPEVRVASHSVTRTCPCETGTWKYYVKTSYGITMDKSSLKTFRVTNCLD